MTLFLYSDPHFGHENIIKYENRPFAGADEMDEELIRLWNETVSTEDRVFVLGDFSFRNREETRAIVARLHGFKHLILGNHDRPRAVKWWKEVGFDEVSEYPLCYGGFFWLSHEPMYLNANMPYVNIHGHIHGQKYEGIQHVNVSVEQTGYRPVPFSSIADRYASEPE